MAGALSPSQVAGFRAEIRRHFRERGRDFPWRRTRDPYAIMVSEFMLQQTQTARVAGKYVAWLERFPTVRSVARAELSEALALWNGLGYNRRAKFLHEACKAICADCGGAVPSDAERLDALPGVGAYTARAISTFAFGNAEVFVETNIRSVFIHFFFPEAAAVPDSDILPLVGQTLDERRPRSWYYALMDYGAALKRCGNPSRRSASYARQGAFGGSLRQARGAVLRQLSRPGGSSGLALDEIAVREGIGAERLREAAERLLRERLVREEGGRYFLG